jgi:KaiC/GvpD/RAD55 family RecA-like ATPase
MSVRTSIDILVDSVESSVILMIGESGTAKEEMAFRFVEDGFQKGENIIVVLFAHSANDYLEELKKRDEKNKKYIEKGQLNIIDAISYRSIPEEIPPKTFFLDNANDLLTLSVTLNEQSKKASKLRIMFDQLALLTLYNQPMQVLNFLQTLAARSRERNQAILLLLDSGVIDEQTEKTLHTIVDVLAETKRTDEPSGPQQLVRIKFAKNQFEPRWVQVV